MSDWKYSNQSPGHLSCSGEAHSGWEQEGKELSIWHRESRVASGCKGTRKPHSCSLFPKSLFRTIFLGSCLSWKLKWRNLKVALFIPKCEENIKCGRLYNWGWSPWTSPKEKFLSRFLLWQHSAALPAGWPELVHLSQTAGLLKIHLTGQNVGSVGKGTSSKLGNLSWIRGLDDGWRKDCCMLSSDLHTQAVAHNGHILNK